MFVLLFFFYHFTFISHLPFLVARLSKNNHKKTGLLQNNKPVF